MKDPNQWKVITCNPRIIVSQLPAMLPKCDQRVMMMVKIEKGAFHLYLFPLNSSFNCGGHDPCVYVKLLQTTTAMCRPTHLPYLKSEVTKRLPTPYPINAAPLFWTPATQFCQVNVTFAERAFPFKTSRELALPLTCLISIERTTCPNWTPNLYIRCNCICYPGRLQDSYNKGGPLP